MVNYRRLRGRYYCLVTFWKRAACREEKNDSSTMYFQVLHGSPSVDQKYIANFNMVNGLLDY